MILTIRMKLLHNEGLSEDVIVDSIILIIRGIQVIILETRIEPNSRSCFLFFLFLNLSLIEIL